MKRKNSLDHNLGAKHAKWLIEVVAAVIATIAIILEPSTWFNRGADIRYQTLPLYTLGNESATGVQLLNEGAGVAENVKVWITTANGTSIQRRNVAGDLSAQSAGTDCQPAPSRTIPCTISLMLGDSTGAIYTSLQSPDELTITGVWGNPARQIRPIEHQRSSPIWLRIFRLLVAFVGFVTIFKWIGRLIVIGLSRAKKRVPSD